MPHASNRLVASFVGLIVMMGLIGGGPLRAHESSCPDDHRCLSSNSARQIESILRQRRCMRTALKTRDERFQIDWKPYHIVVTDQGQIFTKDELRLTLTWCDWTIEIGAHPNVDVKMRETHNPQPAWGVRLRVRLGLLLSPVPLIGGASRSDWMEPAVMMESGFWKWTHLSLHVGLNTFGGGVGVDLTRTVDAYGAASIEWGTWRPLPVLGVSVRLH